MLAGRGEAPQDDAALPCTSKRVSRRDGSASTSFTLTFSPIGLVNAGRGRGGDGSAGPDASEPSGALSLPDAINRQLGLKLDMRKRPMPVLVIDSIEEKPTDN